MITIHRFTERCTEGDLTAEDLVDIWAQLTAERLGEVFFHDGGVRCYYACPHSGHYFSFLLIPDGISR